MLIGLIALTVIAAIALAERSARSITVAVWIVGSAYAILDFGIVARLLSHGRPDELIALACGLAVAAGMLVHRRRPVLAAGLLMAGALGLAAGFGGAPLSTAIAILLVAALIGPAPALLTGGALIRGPRRLA